MDSVTARFASGGSTTDVTEADLRKTARKANKAHKNCKAAQASAPSSAMAILGSVLLVGAVVGAATYLMPSAPKTEITQNHQHVYVANPDTTVASNNVQPIITHQNPHMQQRQPATVNVMDVPQIRQSLNKMAAENGWTQVQHCTEPYSATQLRGQRRLSLMGDICRKFVPAAIISVYFASLIGTSVVQSATTEATKNVTGGANGAFGGNPLHAFAAATAAYVAAKVGTGAVSMLHNYADYDDQNENENEEE